MSDAEVESLVTTIDNPFDPFTQFDEWYAWDYRAGYHTPSFLARIVRTSDELSESAQRQALNDGVDEIVRENVLGIYKKVSRPVSA